MRCGGVIASVVWVRRVGVVRGCGAWVQRVGAARSDSTGAAVSPPPGLGVIALAAVGAWEGAPPFGP